MDAISQTTFSSAFSWMKMFEFRLKFLFWRVQLTIFQHWFRYWLGAVQGTSHYLNQCWLVYRRIYASLGLNELIDWLQSLITISKTYFSNICIITNHNFKTKRSFQIYLYNGYQGIFPQKVNCVLFFSMKSQHWVISWTSADKDRLQDCSNASEITLQAPIPLIVFQSNSIFDQNLECSNLKHAQLITTKF